MAGRTIRRMTFPLWLREAPDRTTHWHFDRLPEIGEEIPIGDKGMYRVTERLADNGNEPEFAVERIRDLTVEERNALLKDDAGFRLPPLGAARLNRVTIATRYGPAEISWQAREQLLNEIRHLDSGRDVVAAFENVGATRPVELDSAGKQTLVDAIHVLWHNAGGLSNVDPGLTELRHKLVDELDAEARGI